MRHFPKLQVNIFKKEPQAIFGGRGDRFSRLSDPAFLAVGRHDNRWNQARG
jgi:hypothetical protein